MSGDVQRETVESWKESLPERRMMCGTWMKQAYFGMLYQIMDLARRVKAVKEGEKASNESQLHFLYLHQVKMKSQLLSGYLKILDVCKHLFASFLLQPKKRG